MDSDCEVGLVCFAIGIAVCCATLVCIALVIALLVIIVMVCSKVAPDYCDV